MTISVRKVSSIILNLILHLTLLPRIRFSQCISVTLRICSFQNEETQNMTSRNTLKLFHMPIYIQSKRQDWVFSKERLLKHNVKTDPSHHLTLSTDLLILCHAHAVLQYQYSWTSAFKSCSLFFLKLYNSLRKLHVFTFSIVPFILEILCLTTSALVFFIVK